MKEFVNYFLVIAEVAFGLVFVACGVLALAASVVYLIGGVLTATWLLIVQAPFVFIIGCALLSVGMLILNQTEGL